MCFRQYDKDFIHKITIFGNSNVGKTTLTKKFVKNEFHSIVKKTIGVDFEIKKLHYENDVSITLQLWDFSGEPHFESLFPMYLSGSDGGLFLFDITEFKSLMDLDRWLKIVYDSFPNVKKIGQEFSQKNIQIPIIMIATKYDLYENNDLTKVEKKNVEDTVEIAKKMAKNRGFDFYITSSKTGKNVNKIFRELANKIKEYKEIITNKESEKKKILTKLYE